MCKINMLLKVYYIRILVKIVIIYSVVCLLPQSLMKHCNVYTDTGVSDSLRFEATELTGDI